MTTPDIKKIRGWRKAILESELKRAQEENELLKKQLNELQINPKKGQKNDVTQI